MERVSGQRERLHRLGDGRGRGGCRHPQAPAPSDATTVTWFDGSRYQSQRINLANTTIRPTVTVSNPSFPGGALTISVSGTLTTGTRTTTPQGASCSTGCQAVATSTSPVSGDLVYRVVHNGVLLAELNLHVDYGKAEAKVRYKEAPSGA